MRIARHRLRNDDGNDVPYRRSPNQSVGFEPEFVVMHYTAGASAESSVSWLTNPVARASAHVLVARDGSLTQMVPFDRAAWHAGTSRWQERSGLNRWSFGIELDNAGPLQRRPDGWYSAWGAQVAEDELLEAVHRHGGPRLGWQVYPPVQLYAAAAVANLLVRHYGLADVIGHDDVAPDRKTDPGPAFPMAAFRARVMGRGDDRPPVERAQVTTALNIRTGPGTQFEKLAASPLPSGTKVEVLAREGAWRQVLVLDTVAGDMDLEGWVHGRYLAPVA